MARANPQWQDFNQGQEALVIFQGPHAYVSPSWYEVHPSVPTWNYAAVHAYGTPRVIDNNTELYALMHTMAEAYEGHLPRRRHTCSRWSLGMSGAWLVLP